MRKGKILSETESLCPVCFQKIPARRVRYGEDLFLEKRCPMHGSFKTVIWRGSPEFSAWSRPKIPSPPKQSLTPVAKGCPFDCGLCPKHGQHTCTALLEITQRCNMSCPVCFAAAREDGKAGTPEPDPDMATLKFWYQRVKESSGPCNIQLSGGEPTVRDDLPEIIAMGKEAGFEFIQLNTNGLRLAREKGFALRLKKAGLSSVFLQFDGTDDAVYRVTRGRALFNLKQAAIRHCVEAGIGVVLVPTVVPGVNDHMLGEIIRFGLSHAPGVRGVHFQPVSYFGRYPTPPADRNRITIPEVISRIAHQSNGAIDADHFRPPGCEHALCSFHGTFMIMPDNALKPLTREGKDSCCTAPVIAKEGARQAISTVARQWAAPNACACTAQPMDDLDRFLNRAKTHIFAISGMAFQDAWNIDIERLKGCCIHTVSPDGRLIPFCAYNVTNSRGEALYRGQA
ncbi:radical SAM (seleno)protein TrsS [Desulfoluna spongiiphila]|uniref:radical SAM (seleno)protein TrsS n=1 Tax=Desulfoluna spongiiphila TaxID=419481 RepID=UPI0012543735|nr:radical SAM (seleno)protein TrsS [Desulfoluna spongiiphila]VVS91553.1 methyltransferase class d [Desulfoluna spongiiphila]